MSRIKFLIAATEQSGVAEARKRGWTQIAFARFATPDKDDVRVVRRFSELPAVPGGPTLIRGEDFGENPEADKFEALIAEGNGTWVDG
ncbi:MAG TPA: hypothetical protein VNF04_04845 [Stellaceae bacterium]|nr:hypothetical protein [Stellaceae bacterium]